MKNDPIVTEVREIRQKLAARFNYDLKAIFDDARQRQGSSGHAVVTRNPRIPGTPGTAIWVPTSFFRVFCGSSSYSSSSSHDCSASSSCNFSRISFLSGNFN